MSLSFETLTLDRLCCQLIVWPSRIGCWIAACNTAHETTFIYRRLPQCNRNAAASTLPTNWRLTDEDQKCSWIKFRKCKKMFPCCCASFRLVAIQATKLCVWVNVCVCVGVCVFVCVRETDIQTDRHTDRDQFDIWPLYLRRSIHKINAKKHLYGRYITQFCYSEIS